MAAALRYRAANDDPRLLVAAQWAALYHDLGKLESENQEVLRTEETGPLPINHVDAGVAHLLSVGQTEAAIAIYAHHKGLCDMPNERAKHERNRQDAAQSAFRDPGIKIETDRRLSDLVARHAGIGVADPLERLPSGRQMCGLDRRLLLSCLVDADHHDTAHHYRQESDRAPVDCRWGDRISMLDRHVTELGKKQGTRTELRSAVYKACAAAAAEVPIWACESAVGTGKTTAVMAYLLRAAKKLELRHIFVVLPFTNIVDQSVKVYRKALVLPGEQPEQVVAAHHHTVEFESVDLRHLTTIWEAPIIVTTAVQFFETIAGHHPARLRKLHQLPGSAVFVDEAHAAMPIHLWPYMWEQIEQLSKQWTCRFVLASGSLARFWENPRIMGEGRTQEIPEMVPQSVSAQAESFERQRITPKKKLEAMNLSSLCDWIAGFKGARLVIVNTVHSAALLARELRQKRIFTLHLSTALAPAHRHRILRRARRYLRWCRGMDWVMVATSCIEAGVDLSFDVGFRERCRVLSLIQTGGRVNREGLTQRADVWDFMVSDPRWKRHPDFEHTQPVVEEVFRDCKWDTYSPAEIASYSLEQEFKRRPQEEKIKEIQKLEQVGDYPGVSREARLIKTDTQLVVINPQIAEAVRRGERVPQSDLLSNSVQLWLYRVKKLALPSIGYKEEIYEWLYAYDPEFLGIMEGVLDLDDIEAQGYAII